MSRTTSISPAPVTAPSRPGALRPGEAIDVSVLVPAKDEAENLPLFMEQAAAAFAGSPTSFEVIV